MEGPEGRFSQFNFHVDLGDGREGGFQELSGLDEALPRIDYRVSGRPTSFSALNMPGLAAQRPITLKRGVIDGGEDYQAWHEAVQLGRAGPRTIQIRQLDADRGTALSWTLADAVPTNIVGAGAEAGEVEHVPVESLDIVCQGISASEG